MLFRSTTLNTLENSLRLSIRPGDMATMGAFLRRVSSINMIDFDALRHGFVAKKLLELIKTPTMKLAPLFLARLDTRTDIFQVFENYDTVFWKCLNDSLRNTVVHITPIAALLRSKLLEVSSSGLRARFLKLSSQTVVSMSDFEDIAIEKNIVRTDRNFVDPTINSQNDRIVRKLKIQNVFLEDNTEIDLTIMNDHFGRLAPPGNILFERVGKIKRCFDSTFDGNKGNLLSVKPDIVATSRIANRTKSTLRAFAFFLNMLFLSQYIR